MKREEDFRDHNMEEDRTSEVAQSFRELREAAELLAEEVSIVEDRFSPVLRPATPEPKGDSAEKSSEYTTDVSKGIAGEARRVRDLALKLRGIRNRSEL